MEIKISEKEAESFDDVFNTLKLYARSNLLLPEDTFFDEIDIDFYEKLKTLYSNLKAGIETEENSIKLGRNYRNLYHARKCSRIRRIRGEEDLLEKRIRASDIRTSINKNGANMSAEWNVDKIFELIGCLMNDMHSANLMKENAGKVIYDAIRENKEVTPDDQHDNADRTACA